ncbi:MAG: YbjN domain-containing protein [Caldilinea sp.]
MPDIATLFDRCGWTYGMPEANLWQSTFFTENEEEFDLYVMMVEDWVHFAVTPFMPPIPVAQAPRLHAALLKLNQQMHSVRFALDSDGDVTLIADAAAQHLSAATFTQILEAIVFYTDRLATELWRMADDPTYFSPLVQE